MNDTSPSGEAWTRKLGMPGQKRKNTYFMTLQKPQVYFHNF